ncbi:Bcr/CflA family multidrug efflux MFS transporter [Aliivibrio kagoshimensis]|uniref:Bcr/CflA family multidrug efflux MFS transporter n=1 Tax=Aliivibrio kagoshimensis TaxID=2910230 RepID=UPI003D0C85E0
MTSEQPAPTLNLTLIVILGAIAALTPLAIDMYLPAMPSIAADLGVTSNAVQITLTAYMAGFAIGQLLHGPLADSYGRKPVLLIGTLFFALASIVSATTTGIEALTWVRVAQGFSGAAAAVVIQAIVRDMFDREDFARIMSFITLVMTVAPLAAPMIGGHMTVWFGWRSIFWLLVVFALIVMVAVLIKIPETLSIDRRQPLRVSAILRNYIQLCKTPSAMGLILTGAFSISGMFAFLTVGSFVYIDVYGVSLQNFGYLFGLNVVCMIFMTSFNGKLVKKMGSHWMIRFGLIIQVIAGLCLVIAQALDLGLWGTVIPVVFYVGTISIIGSNSMALLLSNYPQMAGTASSLAGTLRFGMGSIVGGIAALLPVGTAWPMACTIAVCGILAILFYYLFARDV